MSELRTSLQAHRQVVDSFLMAARSVPATQWSQPRAKGKWSPGQVTEHLALAYEMSRGVLQGAAGGMWAPRFLRPLIRIFLLQPVLRRGRFIPGSRAPKALRPKGSAIAPAVMLGRLEAAAEAFEKYAAMARTPTINHPLFGRLPLADFVRLQEIHTQHHRAQLPIAT